MASAKSRCNRARKKAPAPGELGQLWGQLACAVEAQQALRSPGHAPARLDPPSQPTHILVETVKVVLQRYGGEPLPSARRGSSVETSLTRRSFNVKTARQGMVIYLPKGDENDKTRLPKFYDGIFNFLKSCGLEAPPTRADKVIQ